MNVQDQYDLSGKTVFLTGAAGFLGEYFAHALLDAGANVVLADLQKEALQARLDVLGGEYDGEVLAVTIDVTNTDSIKNAFTQATALFKTIDVVVNNAAIDAKFDPQADPNSKLFENYPVDLLKKSLEVNLLGPVLVAQQAVQHMVKSGGGNIINVSSIYGEVGPDQRIYPDGGQKPVEYAITKGGVKMLTKWLATTYGNKGIRANTYTLGGVFKGHTDPFLNNYNQRSPLGRMNKPEEVGAPLVYLASDASSGMTGANLVVDTGWTAW